MEVCRVNLRAVLRSLIRKGQLERVLRPDGQYGYRVTDQTPPGRLVGARRRPEQERRPEVRGGGISR